MRAIDVKTPPAKAPAAKPSATEAATPLTTKSAATAESPSLLPGIVEALLHFVSAQGIERIRDVARNRHRFGSAVGRNPWNRHPGRNYVA